MTRKLTPKTLAERLADAALRIARVNHYLVGFNATECADVSWDDFTDAHDILVDRENNSTAKSRTFDLAFMVLGAECYRQHKLHLGR